MAYGIIAAGGAGRRMELGAPKLDMDLVGTPLLMYSLEAFERARSIRDVVLVVPAERLETWSPARIREHGLVKVSRTVEGGGTRQESVWKALEAIGPGEGVVVVHDGARPLVTPELIGRVCHIPRGYAGVITAVPLTDTVKEVAAGVVRGTPDRSGLVAVQTPQAFGLRILREAHEAALADGFSGTDDSALVERVGGLIRVVQGSRENLKITYPEDLERAREILRTR